MNLNVIYDSNSNLTHDQIDEFEHGMMTEIRLLFGYSAGIVFDESHSKGSVTYNSAAQDITVTGLKSGKLNVAVTNDEIGGSDGQSAKRAGKYVTIVNAMAGCCVFSHELLHHFLGHTEHSNTSEALYILSELDVEAARINLMHGDVTTLWRVRHGAAKFDQ